MYNTPNIEKTCADCKYRWHDTFHNELYCDHKPLPEGIGFAGLINNYGSCEYWEEFE